MPLDRLLVEVQSPELERVRFVPQGSLEPLRDLVLVMPLTEQVMVERIVQPREDPRRRAHVQELRMLELSPERI
jgi:hypothetical protein